MSEQEYTIVSTDSSDLDNQKPVLGKTPASAAHSKKFGTAGQPPEAQTQTATYSDSERKSSFIFCETPNACKCDKEYIILYNIIYMYIRMYILCAYCMYNKTIYIMYLIERSESYIVPLHCPCHDSCSPSNRTKHQSSHLPL